MLMSGGRSRSPASAKRVKNAASEVCVTIKSYCSARIFSRSIAIARKFFGEDIDFSSGRWMVSARYGTKAGTPPHAA